MLIAWVGSLALYLGAADAEFPADVKAAALGATVNISGGSGVMIHRDEAGVFILTAGHVVGDRDRVTVMVFASPANGTRDRVYRSAIVVARAKLEDLALVRVLTRDKLPPPLPVCPPGSVPRNRSVHVAVVGCDQGEPTVYLDEVKERDVVRTGKNVLSMRFWEAQVAPKPGRSGGPIIDSEKRLLGICSGSYDKKGYYVHVDEIHRFLKNSSLEALFEKPRKEKSSP
jgi:S1-C subfamily serine protease